MFLSLTIAVGAQRLERIDRRVLCLGQLLRGAPYARLETRAGRIVQVHPPGRLGELATVFGLAGNPVVVGIGLVALVAWCWHFSFRQALALPVAYTAALAVEWVCKAHLGHPEPGTVTSFYPYAASNSYPSGHTLTAAFFAVAAAALLPRRLMVCIGLSLLGLVALSRITTGDHWFSDVLGGAVLGAGAAAALFVDRGHLQRRLRRVPSAMPHP